ncbi:MAG: cobalt transporter [Chloroflexota bacterium]|nr:cobalt transporter [Chloroflexota bacterium]
MRNIPRLVAMGTLALIIVAAVAGWIFLAEDAPRGDEAWGGVDVNVIQKYAADAGRVARTPIINTDQGDLLLFVFTISGAVGGFVVSYCWRKLIGEKDTVKSDCPLRQGEREQP